MSAFNEIQEFNNDVPRNVDDSDSDSDQGENDNVLEIEQLLP